MSLRSYLILMTLATVAAWSGWLVVIHGIDPTRADWVGLVLFYATLMMAVFGTVSVTGLACRMWRSPQELPAKAAIRSFRQGILLTCLFSASLFLLSQGWFRWWTMLLVIIITVLLELLFVSSKSSA